MYFQFCTYIIVQYNVSSNHIQPFIVKKKFHLKCIIHKHDNSCTSATKSTQTIKLPSLTANDALLELEYVSVDPYMNIRRQLAQFHASQQPAESFCVAKVVDIGSNVSKFNVNDSVMGVFPCQTHSIVNMDLCHLIPRKVPKYNPDCDTFKNDEMIDLSSIPNLLILVNLVCQVKQVIMDCLKKEILKVVKIY